MLNETNIESRMPGEYEDENLSSFRRGLKVRDSPLNQSSLEEETNSFLKQSSSHDQTNLASQVRNSLRLMASQHDSHTFQTHNISDQ
jgi:hypothetical protein